MFAKIHDQREQAASAERQLVPAVGRADPNGSSYWLAAPPPSGIVMVEMRCSICGTLFDSEQSPAMPFCSVRCKEVDANRWLSEEYGLPWEPEEERPEATDRSIDRGD